MAWGAKTIIYQEADGEFGAQVRANSLVKSEGEKFIFLRRKTLKLCAKHFFIEINSAIFSKSVVERENF